MADVNNLQDRNIYAFIGNIPSFYHSANLRNYFSQFIEQGGFDCFHFRHRPEIIRSHQDSDSALVGNSDAQKSLDLLVNGDRPNDKTSASLRRGRSLCCFIRLRHSKFVELMRMYHRKCWLDRKEESMRSLCYISKIKLVDSANGENSTVLFLMFA